MIPALLILAGAGTSEGQEPRRVDGTVGVFVNTEAETYLRYLQTSGDVAPYPWSIRAFSPRELDLLVAPLGAHPWGGRLHLAPRTEPGRAQLRWVRPRVETVANSAYPWGRNDGAVWAGRGLTVAASGGLDFRYGPVSATIAPVAFWAQNAGFELVENEHAGRLAYADPRYPQRIDLPQRFGSGSYARLDAGQSTLRVDVPWFTVGISSANQHWGPAATYPLLLGNNAPGFLHGFLGTGSPLDLWIGRVHARAVVGRLEQSAYSPAGEGSRPRLMSGLVGTFSPRGLPGLELGAARFYHNSWPRDGFGPEHLLQPFESFLKNRLEDRDGANQLAAVFGRWVFAGSGLEVYGEFSRDDHSWDFRDLMLQPDHISAYLIGLRKQWRLDPTRFVGLRAEVMNAQMSHLTRVTRYQYPFYIHARQNQGHTHRGQILGAPAVYGGAGALAGVDLYAPQGRVSVEWSREVRHPGGFYAWTGEVEPELLDVEHSLGADFLLFRRRFDLTGGLTGLYNFNRNGDGDAVNFQARIGITARHP